MLVRLLTEDRYLRLLKYEVLEKAMMLYNKVDNYRTQTRNLELVVAMYNEILSTMLPVEKPLSMSKIDNIHAILEPGIENLQ